LPEVSFSRSDSYIGVMIDDLTTRGVTEPYRMFTSRAEFRLSLRADNADQRLTPLAIEIGCISQERSEAFIEKDTALKAANEMLNAKSYTPKQVKSAGIAVNQDGNRRTAMQVLGFPDTTFEDLVALDPRLADVKDDIRRQIEKDALYANYIVRQQRDVDLLRKDEAQKIPADFDFDALEGLSNEMKVKLGAARPASLGQAARVDGMTPAALTLLLAHLRRKPRKHSA